MIAATTSKTGKAGFVGGMDIPLIHAFGCGYAQGFKSVKAGNTVIANMTGTDFHAWNDPVKGGELAKSQIDQGADIVYAAAGATGQGVLKAAADAGKLGIGVDSDQDNLFPGKVLTSMLKRVDIATYDTFKSAKDGTWKAGTKVLGLKEGGVGYASDEWNKTVLSPKRRRRPKRPRPTSSPARCRFTTICRTTSARSDPARLLLLPVAEVADLGPPRSATAARQNKAAVIDRGYNTRRSLSLRLQGAATVSGGVSDIRGECCARY